MIDSLTGARVKVCLDDDQGPYVEISLEKDGRYLEHKLDAQYFVPFLKIRSSEVPKAGIVYRFGTVADPAKLQSILDEI
ncbi:hypothetical protein F7234_09070 [Pseudomonas putida]|uniref:hypothetical protein n=1 Tax=Pseudomonas TaxID=286 RepID=UPI00125FB862|nr:hypothetical protein [Pseudomonas putida]KAB5625925.1 hypothetical protein F7234_09070 [Pseudomonas putida]